MLILFLIPTPALSAQKNAQNKRQNFSSVEVKIKKKSQFEKLLVRNNFKLADKRYQLLLMEWQKNRIKSN